MNDHDPTHDPSQYPSQYPSQEGSQEAPSAPSEPPRLSRPSGMFTAILLSGALVVGGLGGLAGAAGFAAVDYLNGDSATASSPADTISAVTDREDTPAKDGTIEDVANSVLPSVVKINVRGAQGQGSGSGIILSSDGEILTNNHVVEVAGDGGTIAVNFDDGSAAMAEIVGTDPLTDLAIIKAQDVSGLTPASLGESRNLDVGEQVLAIGSPFGLEATVTSGIVSAVNRPVSVGSAGPSGPSDSSVLDTTYPAIQTDAAINPGNSGGPLVNMQGEVVGVNSSIRTSSAMGEGGSIGLGFAIPLEKVLPTIDQLRNGETPTHAQLGVTVSDSTNEDSLLTGAGIESVTGGSAADEAGLKQGDVVTKVDDEQISGSESLVATIRGHRPGDTVTLTVVRNGDENQTIDVTLDSDGGPTTP